MRILHLVTYPIFSGPVPPTLGLALAQRAKGHTVWLATDGKRGHLADPFEEPVAPHIAASRLAAPAALTLSTHASPWEYARDVQRLRRLIREARVDVVHAHQSHDHGLLCWLGRDVSKVRTVHAARSLRARLGQRWLFQQVNGVVVRCRAHRDLLVARHTPRATVTVIPGSIDGEALSSKTKIGRDEARAALGMPPQAPLVGMVALMAGRGQEELLRAVALARADVHVLLVGRGSHEPRVRALARQLGIAQRTHFAGYLQRDLLMHAYAACDAMFLAQAGNDASARAALEAMAVGTPLLAVAQDALAELVTPERGFIVQSRAPADIAAALHTWLGNRTRATHLADNARRYVLAHRRFAEEAEATLRFYAHL